MFIELTGFSGRGARAVRFATAASRRLRDLGVLLLPLLVQCCSGNSATASSVLGSPCVPSPEMSDDYSGNDVADIKTELASSSCGGEICVQYHFQGRVTCPYGQTDSDIQSLPDLDPARCRTYDWVTNKITSLPVTIPVQPQLTVRQAAKSVFCTCACAGPDPKREYCSCPANMRCEQLPAGAWKIGTIDGICVPSDSLYDSSNISAQTCSRTSTDPTTDCGGNRQNP